MQLKILCVAFLTIAGFSAGAAADDKAMDHSTAVLAATLSKLSLENPIKDLDANLKRNDRRFVGIYGVACDTPGVSEADRKFVRSAKFGRRCLDGTTDLVENDKHLALIQEAVKYATTYNQELLRRIRAGLIKSN
jgi:outer membrane lipoprotein LolB